MKQERPEIDKVTEYLSHEYQAESYQEFTRNLEAQGWLSRLEQAGIIPVENEPEQREQALKHLYIGALLGQLEEQLLLTPILIFDAREKDSLIDDEYVA